MQCLARLARPLAARPLSQAARTFTTLSPLRPSLTPLRRTIPSFTPTPTSTATATADVVPREAISAHPALTGMGMQLRCGPRNTMNGHTRLVQKRRHGFLYRMRSKTGRRIIMRRRIKGRKKLGW